jgi:hypothetical protein
MTDSGYDIRYSMDIAHMERMLSHQECTKHLDSNNPAALRHTSLHPQVPFHIHETARTVKWRNYPLPACGLESDARGLAEKFDEGYVDYSLCPLGFCDLDWDDVPRIGSADPVGITEKTLIPLYDFRTAPVRVLEQQKTSHQTWLGSTEEEMGDLNVQNAQAQNPLNAMEEWLQTSERCQDPPPSTSASQRFDIIKPTLHIENDTPVGLSKKAKLAPLPAAAEVFFQIDTPEEQTQRLEDKLRLFLHKKQLGTSDEDEYDSDDSPLAVDLGGDISCGYTEVGNDNFGDSQICGKMRRLRSTKQLAAEPKPKMSKIPEA